MNRVQHASTGEPSGLAAALALRVEWGEALLRAEGSDDATFLSAWARVAVELRGLAASGAACRLLDSERGRPLYGRLAASQRRYLLLAERAEVEGMVGSASTAHRSLRELLVSDFGRNTFDRLEEAPRLVDLDACRRVVVVGCGALPAAACFFAERAPASQITAVDVDPMAVELAGRVIERHGAGCVSVLCEDGRDHDYAESDFVYVANQVTPKPDVLRRIAATAPPTVRVLLRDPVGPGRLLADSVDGRLPTPWRVAAAGAANPNFFSRHLLVVLDGRAGSAPSGLVGAPPG